MWKRGALGAVCLAAALTGAQAADPERGRLLHGTFCQGCHDESVAKRESRVAKSYQELRRQVARWQSNTGLNWQTEDVNDVTAYLNTTFYGFQCEGPDC